VGLLELVPQPVDVVFHEWWRSSNMRVHGHVRKGFNSLVVLGVWVIWKHMNLCVFNGSTPSVPTTLQMAREEALLWTVAGAKSMSLLQAVGTSGASSWIFLVLVVSLLFRVISLCNNFCCTELLFPFNFLI
jgi:hypothetical protein